MPVVWIHHAGRIPLNQKVDNRLCVEMVSTISFGVTSSAKSFLPRTTPYACRWRSPSPGVMMERRKGRNRAFP